MRALRLETLDESIFVLGKQVRVELGDAGTRGDARGGALVVAREHDDARKPQAAKLGDGLGNASLERILHADDAHELAIHGKVERREALGFPRDELLLRFGDLNLLVLHDEMFRADDHALAVKRACYAVRHDVLHLGVALAVLEALVGSGAHHRAGHRVREVLLQARGEPKHLVIVPAVKGKHARHLRGCLGERARLVEHDDVGLRHGLEVLRTFHGESRLGGLAHGRQHGYGTGELERAGVVDHKGSRGLHQAARGERHDAGEQEVPRHDAIGKAFHARLRLRLVGLGLLDQVHDGAQLRLALVGLHLDDDLAVLHRRAGEHVVADGAFHGQRLAGKRRLVDHGAPAHHRAVHAHGHTGAHGDELALSQGTGGNLHLGVAFHQLSGLGQVEQRVDERSLRAAARILLKRLAHVEQKHGEPRRARVALRKRYADGRRVEHGDVQPARRQRLQAGEQELAVAEHRPGCRQGRGQEPAPHEVETHQRSQVHEQGMRARGKLEAAALLGLGNGRRVDAGQMVEHARTGAGGGVVDQGHAADARIDG